MTHYIELRMYIDGDWTKGTGGDGIDVLNPATEEVLGQLPNASAADLDRALASAAKGFKLWRSMAPEKRASIMLEAARLIRQRADRIATVTTLEQGKPLAESKAEAIRAASIVEWDANEGLRAYGRIIPGPEGERRMVLREPVGPVAAFSPWNFPSSSPARKIGGSLAAGCSCILKASEEVPGAAVALVECFHDAGLPAGVLNLVFGDADGISSHLMASPIVRKFTFTGSTAVGKLLAERAGRRLLPSVMELGGHAPVLVFDDVDPEKVAAASVMGKFRNAGQVCVSPTRFYVHESVHDRFVSRFAELSAKLKVGNGLEPGIEMGPLANSRRIKAMDSFVADTRKSGGRVVTGGERVGNRGYYYAPTIVSDVPDDAKVMMEEPFGPIAAVSRFRDLDEVIDRANSLEYGLSAYAFTESSKITTRLADRLEVGTLSVNHFVASVAETPFGGVKDSGYGREGGSEGIEAYQTVKGVWQRPL